MGKIQIEQMVDNSPSECLTQRQSLGEPVIIAEDLGVKYVIGSKRENLQSRVFNFLLKKKMKKEFWALKKINFTGYSGEIVGVIGPNGAGKSTFCKLITGLLRPDHGKLVVNGMVSSLLSLGTGFNHQLSGRDNIYLNAMMLGFKKKQIDHIFKDIVQFSGLGNFIEQPLKNYSTGMISRLGFSVGAMIQPEIFILDEALSAGDIKFNKKAGKKLQEIIGRSKMVIMVTHNLGFVKNFCTKALWIDKGNLIQYGDPHKTVASYQEEMKRRRQAQNRKVSFSQPLIKKSDEDVIVVNDLGLKYNLNKGNRFVDKEKGFWPLKKVSFTLKKGEILGIIGRNGQGKTTLCRILCGILKPDKGDAQVNGKTTTLLTFGIGFNPQLTGRDNIYLNGLLLGIPKKKLKKVEPDIIDFSEIGEYIDQPVKTYSNGMCSRLGFSIAAMVEPDIFIIDEALNAGDISFYKKASMKIQELLEKSKAVIVVTHKMQFVSQVCSRGIWLDNGVVKYDGPSKDTVSIYQEAVMKPQF